MKFFSSIILMIAVCLGLMARLTPVAASCQEVVEHCDGHDAHDASDGHDHHHPCSDESSCPVEGHHHHHGPCFLGMHLTHGEAAAFPTMPPLATLLAYETLSLLPPEGPVSDLDKPPLI